MAHFNLLFQAEHVISRLGHHKKLHLFVFFFFLVVTMAALGKL